MYVDITDGAGRSVANWAGRVQPDEEWTTDLHGDKAWSATIRMSQDEAYQFQQSRAMRLLTVRGRSGQALWAGRIEDRAVVDDGCRVTAFGFQHALDDHTLVASYSSKNQWHEWKQTTESMRADIREDRFDVSTDGMVEISPKPGILYQPGNFGEAVWFPPDRTNPAITTYGFTITTNLPANWDVRVYWYGRPFSGHTMLWSASGNGTVQTFTPSIYGVPPHSAIGLMIVRTGSALGVGGEAGDFYARATQFIAGGVATPSLTAANLAAQVAGLPPQHLRSATTWIQQFSPVTMPFQDVVIYQDMTAREILDSMAATPDSFGKLWEWSVDRNRYLRYAPQQTYARRWRVSVRDDIDLERTLRTLYNGVYARWTFQNQFALRSPTAVDAISAAQYGIYRQRAIDSEATASDAAALADATAALASAPAERATLPVLRVSDTNNVTQSKDRIIGGDIAEITNTRQRMVVRVASTRYRPATDDLDIELGDPLPR